MKRVSIFVFCILLIGFNVLCQNPLIVPPVLQKDNTWCWAACTEMVTKYNGNRQSQCNVARDYFSVPSCTCGLDCGSTSTRCTGSLNPANFRPLLRRYNYNPIADNYINWTLVRQQINNNCPFIIGINRSSSSDNCKVTHYIVGKGYYTRNGINFINTNDPFACGGINNIEIRHFTPNQSESKSCFFLYDIKKSITLRMLQKSQSLIIDSMSLSQEDCQLALRKSFKNEEIYNLKDYQVVPVYYADNLIETNVVDVISKKKCNNRYIVTRMQFINGVWEPAFILQQVDAPLIKLNKTHFLSNDIFFEKDKIIVSYDKIIFASHPYEFYRYKIVNKDKIETYYTLAHVAQATIDNFSFKKGQILREKDFSKIMFKK